MRTVTISERAKDNVLHIEAPGCIVNITVGLTNNEGKRVTHIEVLGDHYVGEEWDVLYGDEKASAANIRVIARHNKD